MASMIFKIAMYMILLNLTITFVNAQAVYWFPNNSAEVQTTPIDLGYLNSLWVIASLGLGVTTLSVLIFTFRPLTFALVFALYGFGTLLTANLIYHLPLPTEIKLLLGTIITIIYFVGASQYANGGSQL